MGPPVGKRPSHNADLLRIMDVNLNRCREGLRVLEDSARFVWRRKAWFQAFRAERHRLDLLTRKFYPQLVAARDSAGDHGRSMPEAGRGTLSSVLFANFRRCEESLRVLEEFGKLVPGRLSAEFKRARFRVYDLEKTVLKTVRS